MTALNTRQAAEFLGVSPRTLEGLRIRGGGPAYFKVGARVVYGKDELREFITARQRTSTSQQTIGASAGAP
jgi:hypothetical protein